MRSGFLLVFFLMRKNDHPENGGSAMPPVLVMSTFYSYYEASGI